jgi:hypothetical protein
MSDSSSGLRGADILAFPDRKIEKVPVPEWNGHVYLRSLSAEERDAFSEAVTTQGDQGVEVNRTQLRERLLVLSLCDEQGNRLLSDAEIAQLSKKNSAVIQRLFMRAKQLSGMADDAVERAVKNS